MKYVIQVTNGTIMPALSFNVIKNLSAIEDTEEITVVFFGPSVVSLLHHAQLRNQLKDSLNEKTKIYVCRNAMNMFDLKDSDVPDYAAIVPAGVYEIAKLVKSGAVYIAL